MTLTIFYNRQDNAYYHVGVVPCNNCKDSCTPLVVIREHYFKEHAGQIERLCARCVRKKSTIIPRGDWRITRTCVVIETRDALPANSVPIALIPSGLQESRTSSVWIQAADNSDPLVEVQDQTVISGRVQCEEIDLEQVRQQLEMRDSELDSYPKDCAPLLLQQKNAVPITNSAIEYKPVKEIQ